MSYELVYTRKAIKDIQRLDPEVKDRIGKTLLRYQENPLSHAERLTDAALGGFRFRIGDYRVIFDLEGNEIVILRVGHRREIYKR
jgi:mRNA interferase RelE/StbE